MNGTFYIGIPHNNCDEAVRFQQEVFFAIISCFGANPRAPRVRDFFRRHDFTLI